jgi:hypothetical protein
MPAPSVPPWLSDKPWSAALPDLEGLLDRLIHHGVEFVVVGGFAAVAHGVTLLTQDIDICCRFVPDNLMRLQDALADLEPVHRMPSSRPPLRLTRETAPESRNLYLDTGWGQLDCLGDVLGVGDYDRVLAESISVRLSAGPCRILSVDALIRAKEAMGRERDRQAVVQLRAIRERSQSR